MKRKLIILNIFIVFVILCTSVYAATAAKLNLIITPEGSSMKAGEKFTVKLSLKDFDKATSVDTIAGYIDIDENILEDITVSSIIRTNTEIGTVKIGKEDLRVYDVTQIEGMPEKGIFLMKDPADADHDYKITVELSTDNKITTEDIIKIEFETKDNLEEDTYEDVIKFVGFEATSGWTETVNIEDENVSIEISLEQNTNDGGSDDAGSDDAGNGDAGNGDAGNGDTGNGDTGNGDAGNDDAGNGDTVNDDAGNGDTVNGNAGNDNDGNKVDGNKNTVNQANTSKNTTVTNTKDNTTANKILPATGATSIIVKIIAVGLLLGFIVYAKYKKYKNI